MAQMPSEFTKGRYRSQLRRQKPGLEVVALVLGIGMNIGTRITEGEVVVEAGSDLLATGTVGGKKIIVAGAGALVQVLIITKIVGEADMTMSGGVEAGPMIVPPLLGAVRILGGARLLIGHLLGLKVLMHAIIKKALLYQKLLHHMVDLLILEARLLVDLMLMNEGAAYDVMEISLAQCVLCICFNYGADMLS